MRHFAIFIGIAAALIGVVFPARAAQSPFPDKLTLVNLLRAGQTAELDRRLTKRQDRYELGDESHVEFAFRAFANSASDLEPRLAAWVKDRPGSFAARAARGMYYFNLGWLARQGRYARDTRKEQFQRMRAYFKKARADFRAAIKVRPRFGFAYARLYEMAVADGTGELRDAILSQGFAADPGSPPLYRARMWSLQPNWLGSLKDMEDFALHAEARRLTNHRTPILDGSIYLYRAKRFRRTNQNERAMEILSEGIALHPSAELYVARGDLHQSNGDDETAVADFTRALELQPQDEAALRERAASYRRLGKTEAALADLALAMKLDARDPRQLRQRARLNWRLKRYDAVLKDLDAAMEFGKWDAWTHDFRGRAHLAHTKDNRKAAKDFKRATELSPATPRYWYNLAVAYHRLEDCNTVKATQRYLQLCARGGKCKPRNIRVARTVIPQFVKTHEACKAMLPPPPSLWARLWNRFKSGLVKIIVLIFLEPKAE